MEIAQPITPETDTPLLDQLINAAAPHADNEHREITTSAISALLEQLDATPNTPIDRLAVDRMIADIDTTLSKQLDHILHHPEFQALEAQWRSVKFLVDRTNFRENIKLDLLNCSKNELIEDFDEAPDMNSSGLYQIAYNAEYAQFGGEPYAAMIGNYAFSHQPGDCQLLSKIADVAEMAHAPFIASTSLDFFGLDDMNDFANLEDIEGLLEGEVYAKWRSLRQRDASRYLGLTLPRFMLRLPHAPSHQVQKSFIYHETASTPNDYLWGNAAFALATCIVQSFAQYRWCPNIIGPANGGLVDDLPLHHYEFMGEMASRIPTEALLSDHLEYSLSQAGFIPLVFRKGSDNAAFFSANALHEPKTFGESPEGKQKALNEKLGSQLPYMFVISRIAHYLKVLQREQLGAWKEASDLEVELNKWLSQYIANQDNAPHDIRCRKPLRQARVIVHEANDEPGWYHVDIQIRPHFKYMGSDITLSLRGKLEQPRQ